VNKPQNSFDLWRIPILILWTAFFAVGLYPEWVYDQSRELGQVAVQRALTNSAWLISLAWAGYLGWFTLARCREAGDIHAAAAAKGVQVLLLGLTAFMPLRLENIAEIQYIPVPSYRWIVYGTVGAKGIAWLYLVLTILRYYLFSGYMAFINMPALFPSAHESGPNSIQSTPDTKIFSTEDQERGTFNPVQANAPSKTASEKER
jgi:hypothetical protein